jgi:tetratricopeptide (TPR) repeat protein
VEEGLVCDTKDKDAKKEYQAGYRAAHGGDEASAQKLYESALARDPSFCDAMDNLGNIYRHQGRLDDAVTLYRKSLGLAPTNYAAHISLGLTLRKQGKLDESMAVYEAAMKLDEQNPEGYYGLGVTLFAMRRVKPAIIAVDAAEKLYVQAHSPLVYDARLLLGIAHGALKEWREARDKLEPDYEHFASNSAANMTLGEIYLQPEFLDKNKARSYLERARAQGAQVPTSDWDALK